MHPVTKAQQITDTLRNQVCDLELVTRLRLADGTTQEITHARRAVCKMAKRRQNRTVLTFADLDRSSLERAFPFETFTVADFPELFVDHVGRRVPQGVGTVRKVPMTLIAETGGVWKFAGPKVIGAAGTVLTVYRGSRPGQGAIVAPTEYTVGTATGASTGVTVLTVNFAREQIDFQGRQYLIEIDCSLPGSRIPADELQRVLAAYGISVNAASFAAAVAYDTGAGFAVDALYGGDENGRTGNAIVEDLLRVARAWLEPDATGAWSLVQDSPRVSVGEYDTSADQVEITEYGDGDIAKTVTLAYRPKSGVGEAYANTLSRTTTGAAGEKHIANPYVSDHGVADRLLCYWQKRLNALRQASGSIHAVQHANGDRITVTDSIHWNGTKDFILTGIRRPADRNQVTLREYDAAVYVYTAGTLPADATNGYSPDYAYTPPAAPTGLAVVSQGATVAADGTMRSFALVRATPPAANWARLMIQVTNSVSSEIYQAQLLLNAGNYEARITGMHPNVAHTVTGWAVNSNNIDGIATAPVGFTSTTIATNPDVPTGLTVVSSANAIDENQIQTSYVVLRATPPANYFRRMMAQVTNTVSGEAYQVEFILAGGTYDAKVEGLRANVAHNATAWALNFENFAGAQTTPVSFTTPITGTSPDVPTGLTKASGGTHVANDGTITAYALIRATPPANYFRSMHCRVKDNVTGELHFGALILNGANYEATITGLHPNVSHDVVAWAVNSNDVWSAFTVALTFTSDTVSTSPAVPTALTHVSGGATVAADGVVRAYALIRATPPVNYFKALKAQVKDTTTNAIQQAQLLLSAGNYEARFDGLLCNRAHEVIAWAVNASGDDGAVTVPVAFTSANHTSLPAAPTSMAIAQGTGKALRVSWVLSSSGSIVKEYIVFRKIGAGSYAEYRRVNASYLLDEAVGYTTTYYYKVRAVDRIGNESADSAEVSATLATNIDDNDIPIGGINGVTIGNGAINRGRSYTGTGSASGTINAGNGVNVSMDLYTFFPNFKDESGVSWLNLNASLGASADTGSVGIHNTSASNANYSVTWRNFLT